MLIYPWRLVISPKVQPTVVHGYLTSNSLRSVVRIQQLTMRCLAFLVAVWRGFCMTFVTRSSWVLAKVLNGSVLTYLCEAGIFGWDRQNFGQYPILIGRALREAYKQFNQWKKDNRIAVSQPRFTAARLSRMQRTSYPCLSSKAAASKAISFWLLSCAIEHGRSPEASDLDKHVANCIWTYAEVLRLLDEFCFK